jgi:N-acetylglucosaminyldiphosphoundecaprenol N-acetyl-beta-D-mannosaminyltransferase
MRLDRVDILGTPLDCVETETAVARIDELIASNGRGAVLAVNPEKVIRAQKDPHLRSILARAAVLIPDGIGVVLAARWLHGKRIGRVPGSELMPRLCELARDRNYGVYLFGAAPAVIEETSRRLRDAYKGIRIVGQSDGYVSESQMPALIKDINERAPDLLFVALGSPKQEAWIDAHMDELNVKICQGVGGTFDVIAGRVKRAPKLLRDMHLEWLYRLLSHPQRITRQGALPVFALQLGMALLARAVRKS